MSISWEESMQFFRDKGFFQFEDLDPNAQKIAMREVTKTEKDAHLRKIKEAKQNYSHNRNKAINDQHHIKRLINGAQAYYKIKKLGNSYLVKFIKSNLVWFNLDGTKADIFK